MVCLSYDRALDEVVAESCQRFLMDTGAMEKLVELATEDMSLFKKMLAHIKQWIANIRKAFSGSEAQGRESEITNTLKALEQLRAMWEEALEDATRNYRASKLTLTDEIVKGENGEKRDQTAVTPEEEARYLELAQDPAKNEAELERMVAEAAKRAFPKSKVKSRSGDLRLIYHGTEADFTEFDPRKFGGKTGIEKGYGIYLTTRKTLAEHYGDRVIEGYANITKPARSWDQAISLQELQKLIRNLCERDANAMLSDGYDSVEDAMLDTWISNYVNTYEYGSIEEAYRAVAFKIMGNNDNDADIIGEIMNADGLAYSYEAAMGFDEEVLTPSIGIDGFDFLDGNDHVYLAFSSAQIKSADPVTYDDDGNVIPLSRRFDSKQTDIRYQAAAAEYDPETASVKQQLDHFKDALNKMDAVCAIVTPTSFSSKEKAAKIAIDRLKKWGFRVDRHGYGTIFFTENDIRGAVNYADSNEEKAALLALPYVLKRGVEVGSHNNHKSRQKQTKTFAAPVSLNGQRGNMAAVVNKRGNHFYVSRIVNPDGSAFVFTQKEEAGQESPQGVRENASLAEATSTASMDIIRNQEAVVNTEAFKEWFGDSKVVNEDGTPKIVYHGTDAEFTDFDPTKGRSTMDIQGMFFSPWELDAQGYGKNVGAYYLSIQNPAPEGIAYKALNMFKGQNNAGVKARQYLESLGYDGVNNGDEEFIAFYPEQIKSATDNVGTYDRSNPDIRYQEEGTSSTRELLSQALMSAAQGEADKAKLEQYQKIAHAMDENQKLLEKTRAKIRGLSFAKGPRDTEKIQKKQPQAFLPAAV